MNDIDELRFKELNEMHDSISNMSLCDIESYLDQKDVNALLLFHYYLKYNKLVNNTLKDSLILSVVDTYIQNRMANDRSRD